MEFTGQARMAGLLDVKVWLSRVDSGHTHGCLADSNLAAPAVAALDLCLPVYFFKPHLQAGSDHHFSRVMHAGLCGSRQRREWAWKISGRLG